MRLGGASTGGLKNLIRKSGEDIRALRNNGFHFPIVVVLLKNIKKLPHLLIR
jgi:glycosyltransferase